MTAERFAQSTGVHAGRCPRLRSLSAFPATPPLLYHHPHNNIGKEAHMTTQGLFAGSVAATLSLAAVPTGAQERSLDEIKKEVMRRAGHINPFEGIRREDAEQIVAALTSLDRDHWAAAWCKVGLGYEEKADARAKAGAPGRELAELYTLAFEIGR